MFWAARPKDEASRRHQPPGEKATGAGVPAAMEAGATISSDSMKLDDCRTAGRISQAPDSAITLNSRCIGKLSNGRIRACYVRRDVRHLGASMTAVIYNFDRARESSPIDETERLVSALGRYTSAELLELLYVGEEPGFFELIRGLFSLSDESRLILQNFLAAVPVQGVTVSIDRQGRCVLTPEASSQLRNPA